VKTLVYGSRPDGHAKVVLEIAGAQTGLELVGLVDDYDRNAERTVRGLRVLGTGSELAKLRAGHARGLLLGFGESAGRAEIGEQAVVAGFELPVLVHESAFVCASAWLGEGAQILALTYIGPDAQVGRFVLVNTGAIVEHDAVLEDGAVLAPGVRVCGRVAVGREATVGAGATILPDVRIGAGAVVGAGSLVREDVPERARVAGVPARRLP
jgi:UDP-perosamine 4-acetyltransferase